MQTSGKTTSALPVKGLIITVVKNPPSQALQPLERNKSRIKAWEDWKKEVEVAQNDTKIIRGVFQKLGARQDDIVQLDNFQVGPTENQPTYDNIMASLKTFTNSTEPVLGHGGCNNNEFYCVPSDGIVEDDKLDRVITAHLLRQYLVDCLPPHSEMVIVLDCCEAGNGLGFPYVYAPAGIAPNEKSCERFFPKKENPQHLNHGSEKFNSTVVQLSPCSDVEESFESDQGGPTARVLELIFNSETAPTYGSLLFQWCHWLHLDNKRLNEDIRKYYKAARVLKPLPPRQAWISSMTELNLSETFILSRSTIPAMRSQLKTS